ncbi:MAG: hypothetical protein R3C99_15655 [Pirellulaceae bacterium]|nr:hypothetical protein [Planctomycetales bacterium]MCA9222394.1 hypothetical protein [Planctomycetales bacterium]MCA9226688.1 hypothetical protein [Planctomycetales bacterium]
MNRLREFWEDENGGLIAAEYLLLGTLLTIGLLVGIHAVQEAMLTKLGDLADLVSDDTT